MTVHNPQKIFLIGLIVLLIIIGFLITQNIRKDEIQEIKDTITQTLPTPPAPQPTATSSDEIILDTIVTKIGQGGVILGTQVVPLQVVEDSRCPANAICIQAGTVRVEAEVTVDSKTSTQVFKLDTPVKFGNQTITLIKVEPYPSGEEIKLADYLFTFKLGSKD